MTDTEEEYYVAESSNKICPVMHEKCIERDCAWNISHTIISEEGCFTENICVILDIFLGLDPQLDPEDY